DTAIATMAAIVRDEPKPLDVPAEVARVVARCLRKSPAERFQTAAELRVALAASTLSKPEETSSAIAVLPFANLSADRENEYFSDGLAEEILNALSQVAGLNIAARTSSFSFKGKAVEIGEIAARLNVSNVLQGSVRRAANRVRVTVQLVDARNGFQIWSERYDRQMEDIFEVQDEIASAIAERLKVTFSSVVKPSTRNLEAYERYLKGRYYWHQRTPAAVRLAIQCFEQTIQLDPQYARDGPGARAIGSELLARLFRVLLRAGMAGGGATLPERHRHQSALFDCRGLLRAVSGDGRARGGGLGALDPGLPDGSAVGADPRLFHGGLFLRGPIRSFRACGATGAGTATRLHARSVDPGAGAQRDRKSVV